MPSDPNSGRVNFLGDMTPDPLVLACFKFLCALHTMYEIAFSTSTMMTNLVVPTVFKSLDPPLRQVSVPKDTQAAFAVACF